MLEKCILLLTLKTSQGSSLPCHPPLTTDRSSIQFYWNAIQKNMEVVHPRLGYLKQIFFPEESVNKIDHCLEFEHIKWLFHKASAPNLPLGEPTDTLHMVLPVKQRIRICVKTCDCLIHKHQFQHSKWYSRWLWPISFIVALTSLLVFDIDLSEASTHHPLKHQSNLPLAPQL